MLISHAEKVERFGFDPTNKRDYLGIVRTARFTMHGSGDYTDWEIYFSEQSKSIDVCFLGCNGTYLTGIENSDGTTTLPPLFDAVFQQLRKGEYVPVERQMPVDWSLWCY